MAGARARVTCTRKTTPGLRVLEKRAVHLGGGINHRFSLGDAVLIKDNHTAAAGGVRAALERAMPAAGHMQVIEIEVDTLAQLREALPLKPHCVLLDTIGDIAATGVDYISVGALTHSSRRLDLGLDEGRAN